MAPGRSAILGHPRRVPFRFLFELRRRCTTEQNEENAFKRELGRYFEPPTLSSCLRYPEFVLFTAWYLKVKAAVEKTSNVV